jgi:acid phosphatase
MWRLLIALTLILRFGPSSARNHPVIPDSQSNKNATADKHFDRVLIIVLENESYVSAIKDKYLRQLADEGVEFTDFRAVQHPSYPNYLAMISGSTFGIHGLRGDSQHNFPDDSEHKTIADLLDWKNYAENYPTKPVPYLGDGGGTDAPKYARKHVPFLSFEKVQNQGFKNVISVDTNNRHNAFITDVENSKKSQTDRSYKPLATYMFYTPNMDDDGHDTNVGTASTWLKNFLENWFPPDARSGTLIVITFDEAEAPEKRTNHIYTIFLGAMVKTGQKINHRYDHYDVLRTIESNFGLPSLNSGDGKASVITDVWK